MQCATDHPVNPAAVASALAWWRDAGFDTLIEEAPQPWLGRKTVARSAEPARPVRADARAEAAPAVLPGSLTALVAHLVSAPDLVEAGPLPGRIAASGAAGSAITILIDMPEADDSANGMLLSGESRILFERMLAAIGLTRETCYIAALCPGRAPGGILPEESLSRYAALARQHVALSGAKRVWGMGQAANRALIGADARAGTAGLHKINHEGAMMEAVASFSPRFLLGQPKRKAQAWADMQALIKGIGV